MCSPNVSCSQVGLTFPCIQLVQADRSPRRAIGQGSRSEAVVTWWTLQVFQIDGAVVLWAWKPNISLVLEESLAAWWMFQLQWRYKTLPRFLDIKAFFVWQKVVFSSFTCSSMKWESPTFVLSNSCIVWQASKTLTDDKVDKSLWITSLLCCNSDRSG